MFRLSNVSWKILLDRRWQELGKEVAEMSNYTFFASTVCMVSSVIYLINLYYRCPKVITLNDVHNALTSREEFDIFTNEGLGSKQELNTTEQ